MLTLFLSTGNVMGSSHRRYRQSHKVLKTEQLLLCPVLSAVWTHLRTNLDPVSKYDITIGNHVACELETGSGQDKTQFTPHFETGQNCFEIFSRRQSWLVANSVRTANTDKTRHDSFVSSVSAVWTSHNYLHFEARQIIAFESHARSTLVVCIGNGNSSFPFFHENPLGMGMDMVSFRNSDGNGNCCTETGQNGNHKSIKLPTDLSTVMWPADEVSNSAVNWATPPYCAPLQSVIAVYRRRPMIAVVEYEVAFIHCVLPHKVTKSRCCGCQQTTYRWTVRAEIYIAWRSSDEPAVTVLHAQW